MCASGRQSSTGWSDEVQPDPTLDLLYVPGGGLGVDRTDTSGSFTADELQQMKRCIKPGALAKSITPI